MVPSLEWSTHQVIGNWIALQASTDVAALDFSHGNEVVKSV